MAGVIELATYAAKLELDDKFTAGMIKAETQGKSSSGNLNSTFSNLGSTLLKVGSIFGVGISLKSFIDDAAEAESGVAQLEAVLKSTGSAVGMTADEITGLAGELQKTTKFSDDEILSAQNLLLTFTNIGKDVFPQATETLLDMATAMGGDASSNAIQLGKALNDPSAGISALTRVGVTFSEDQKKVIKSLQDTGDTAGAQKIILAELSKEFGGSATAAGETYAGQMARLKNQMGEVSESIGGKILPYLTQFANYIISNMPKIKESIDNAITKAGQIVDGLAKAIKFVIDNSNILIPVIGGIATAMAALSIINVVKGAMDAWKASTLVATIAQNGLNAALLANPIGIVVAAIAILVAAGIALYMNWDKVSAFLSATWENIKKLSNDTFKGISDFISNTWNTINTATENVWNGIKKFFSTVWDGIVWIFKNLTLLGIITSHWNDIKNATNNVWNGIKEFFSKLWDGIVWMFKNLTIVGIIASHWNEIKTSTQNIWNGIKSFFVGIWDGIIKYMDGIPSTFKNIGTNIFNSLWDGLKGVWTNITGWIENSINWIKDKLSIWKSSQKEMSNGDGGNATITVPSYDVGTSFVQSDQLALIHKGEAVLRADQNPWNPENSNSDMNTSNYGSKANAPITLSMGDIVIHGNADKNTVTDIKDAVQNGLNDFVNKIQRTSMNYKPIR